MVGRLHKNLLETSINKRQTTSFLMCNSDQLCDFFTEAAKEQTKANFRGAALWKFQTVH